MAYTARYTMFQSTLPRRERRSDFTLYTFANLVSIHAPTKGATLNPVAYALLRMFQSTLPRRERPTLSTLLLLLLRFQSTLPRRERREITEYMDYHVTSFNPRSHEGSDKQTSTKGFDPIGFNPRSHEGSDATAMHINQPCSVFQSTLPRRERPV